MTDFLSVFGTYDFFVRSGLLVILLAYSLYLLLNAGIFAVPQIGFMAVGAYTAAILDTQLHWPLPATLLAGMAAGTLTGGVLGALLARLDGIYLAIGTIAFSEMVRVTAQYLDITGGTTGLTGIDTALSDLYIVGALAACVIVVVFTARSRHGVAMVSMRTDPLMTSHQGISTARYRLALFAASGAVAALVGAMEVHLTGFVEPGSFTFDALTTVLAATVVGGMTSVTGPILGVCVILGVPQLLSSLDAYRHMVNGIVIVLVVAFAPGGLVTLLKRGWWAVRQKAASGRQVADGPSHGPVSVMASGPDQETVERELVRETARAGQVSGGDPERRLSIKDISRRFGGVQALQSVSFEVRAGEVFGLIGPNGSGKSTLLNVLSGVYKPSGGSAILAGRPLDAHWGAPPWLSRAGVARTFQNIRLIEDLSVEENIVLGAHYRLGHMRRQLMEQAAHPRCPGRGNRRAAVAADQQALIAEFGLTDALGRQAGSLPYGLQRRVEICRALLSKPDLLLLDEPTAGMTPAERADVFAAIRQVAAGGVIVVVVEHDVETMLSHCDRMATLHFGRVIAIGHPKDVIESKAVIEAYVGGTVRS